MQTREKAVSGKRETSEINMEGSTTEPGPAEAGAAGGHSSQAQVARFTEKKDSGKPVGTRGCSEGRERHTDTRLGLSDFSKRGSQGAILSHVVPRLG